ncbi:hypothetical protein ERO13_D12G260950v2 [Gossypium hirsutum]|uniref:Cytochrome P450 n=3 Tax=Gossypium TaxID=3633 RepID=A0A5J5P3S9_GOSBA|nr:hypothetical protein ES319_D12G287800v1 [Gossypium barbadense]KAG4117928.1 hypothetical protein ERO13_D12G260950v2 [Gossypium hirsutum]TYG43026.1 hypothetical protein ES288_D12G303600v1 [Gossypium darwinii]TYH41280.1 hypothetical protein ES332_D12G305000v1 [Gossypium tomentosum]
MVHCFKTSLVGRQIVVSTDPDVNHFIFQQEGKLVQSCHGFLHKYLRNLILNLFGSESLKTKHVSEIEELTSKHLQLWSCQQPSVELKQAISTMIYDFTVRKLFSFLGCYSAFLDGLISFPLNIPGPAYWKCLQGHKDFLDVVLEEMNKAGIILSEQTALDLLFALPFAAFESASSAVVLALQYLQSNPLAQVELTQEHETILRERETKDSGITWKEYKSMTVTHMVNETIRLGNIVPAIFRKVVKDIEIKDYKIPAGWIILACTLAGRELNAGSKFFMGFGSVVRLCAGAEFVKLQISIFLHHLVTNYRWTVIKEGKAVGQPGLVFPDGFHVQILNKKFI